MGLFLANASTLSIHDIIFTQRQKYLQHWQNLSLLWKLRKPVLPDTDMNKNIV